jgi:hypothetical protein
MPPPAQSAPVPLKRKKLPRRLLEIVFLWLALRLVLSLWIALSSSFSPQTALEKQVPLWPPTTPLGDWWQRVFVMPWYRWDVEYFLNIAVRGYRLDDGTAQFHPLYPWLGQITGHLLGGNMLLGLLVASSLCALLLLLSFERWALLDLPAEAAWRATLYFAHAPVAFILFAPYSEATFLLCGVLALFAARRGVWWQAGLAGGLAALTRQQGIFLLLPLAWELWEWSGRRWRALLGNWRGLLGLALVPAGLLLWLLYRAWALGDVAFDFSQPRTLIYGLLISRSATRVVHVQSFMPPWQALWTALQHLNVTTVIDLSLASFFLLLLILGARPLWRLRPSYFLYALAIILVSFSYSTGPREPYMGLPRHCLLAFPLFLPLALWGKRWWVHWLVILYGILGLLTLALLYTTRILWLP